MSPTHRPSLPVIFILINVALFSLIPPLIAISASAQSPFLFNAAWKFALIAGSAVYLLTTAPKPLRSNVALSALIRALRHPAFLLMMAANTDIIFFNASLRYTDAASATIAFFAAPAAVIWLLSRLFAHKRPSLSDTTRQLPLALIALCGAALVIVSQNATIPHPAIIGVAIALAGALTAALTPFGLHWARQLRQEMLGAQSGSSLHAEVAIATAGAVIAHIPTTLASAAIGIALAEPLNAAMLTYAIIGGLIISTPATLLWRAANLTRAPARINALAYLAPALSVAWLYALQLTIIHNPIALITGVIAIIAANIALNRIRAR